MNQQRILILIVLCFSCLSQSAFAQTKQKPVDVIFDTDIGADYDDVGAMAVLHALSDSGQVNILATVACNQSRYIARVLDVLNTYFGRPDIPIGVVRGRAINLPSWQKWDSLITARYPHDIRSNAQAQDGLELYRKTLTAQPDSSVTIITVGFFTNLADLLQSAPDKHSPLSGRDLITKKVKQLVCMAGRFPEGKEFNVDRDPVSSKIVFDGWPTNIYFSGWEIGGALHTGLPLIRNMSIQNSPVKDAFAHAIPMSSIDAPGRMSWDQTAVLVGVRGYAPFYNVVEGKIRVSEDGSNQWDKTGKGHFYLVQKMPVKEMEDLLNRLMMHQPKKIR